MNDNVHTPKHYTSAPIETIDYIAANLGPDGFKDYCLGNVIKYVSRWRLKNGTEDLRKARVYLGWAIDGRDARVPLAPPPSEWRLDEPIKAGGTD